MPEREERHLPSTINSTTAPPAPSTPRTKVRPSPLNFPRKSITIKMLMLRIRATSARAGLALGSRGLLTTGLPTEEADVVVIGAGVIGLSIAKELVSVQPRDRVTRCACVPERRSTSTYPPPWRTLRNIHRRIGVWGCCQPP